MIFIVPPKEMQLSKKEGVKQTVAFIATATASLKAAASSKKLFTVNYFEYRDQFDRQFEKCPSLTRIRVRDAIGLLVKHINSSGFESEHVQKTVEQFKDIQNGKAKVARFGLQVGVVFV